MCAEQLIEVENPPLTTLSWADIIKTHSAPDDIVLVPFADGANIAQAALATNRRAVLLARTASQRLRLWGQLAGTDAATQRRALARLAGTTKRDTPLDRHVNNLYQTTCPSCGAATPAIAFIWDPGRHIPVEKELACEHCSFSGRTSASSADAQRAAQFERRGLSFWFILEWLVDAQDVSGRDIVRRQLDAYSPRNLTALADITRKIDAEIADDPAAQRVLRLWLLNALGLGRQQPDPQQREHLIERNVWHLLTNPPIADEPIVPVHMVHDLESFFGAANAPPNVALVSGPTRTLARQLPPDSVAVMLGTPPALDASSWIWEQLWSRWLFGRGMAAGLQPPVGGWARHVRALGATMAALLPALRTHGRVVFRFRDDDPNRVSALLTATAASFALHDFIYQPPVIEPSSLFEDVGGTYSLDFAPSVSDEVQPAMEPATLAEAVEATAADAARSVIDTRAEPLRYGWLFAASMERLAQTGLLRQAMVSLEADTSPLVFLRQHIRQGLRVALSEGVLTGVGADDPTHWWLPEPPPTEPLAEQVEDLVVELLDRETVVTLDDVYRRASGWLTPELELLEAVFMAYGSEAEGGGWRQRAVEPAERQIIVDAVRSLGERLDYAVGTGFADIIWGESGHATHAFRVPETGRWRELGIEALPESVGGYLVIPERLIELLRIKLLRNPLLRNELARHGWALIKAPHLLTMADEPEVDRQQFRKVVGLDPIIEKAEAQMPLF